MTPTEVYAARATLGQLRNLNRPMSCNELAQELRLKGNGGDTIRKWERGSPNISGPASLALEALLSGWRPND